MSTDSATNSTTDSTIDTAEAEARELFRALELAHYADRFRDAVFVIALPAEAPLSELLIDFRVLAGYRIRVVLVTRDPEFRLESVIAQANKRGSRYQLLLLTDLLLTPGEDVPGLDYAGVQASVEAMRMPVIAYHGSERDSGESLVDETFELAAQVAHRLGAQKLLLVTPLTQALRDALPRSSVQASEMEALPARLRDCGLAHAEPLCAFAAAQCRQGIPGVVLLEATRGHLFREVFTYDGSGVLFTATRATRIRRAEMGDVTDIALLLRPEIERGAVLPVPESRIEAMIDGYWLYEIDGMPVGVACLKHYGPHAELAQFATLPRYRGRGRARELAQFLIAHVRDEGLRSVFALSVDPRMWEFFEALGFAPVARESLPAEWLAGYDLGRPSRALRMEL